MSTATITQAWAGSLAATSFDDLPPAVVHRARLALLDFLGVALAGRDQPMSRLTAAYLLSRADGRRPA
jgi:2-methylcitrate dehydratase PrpD